MFFKLFLELLLSLPFHFLKHKNQLPTSRNQHQLQRLLPQWLKILNWRLRKLRLLKIPNPRSMLSPSPKLLPTLKIRPKK
jgi:hypothetical protein